MAEKNQNKENENKLLVVVAAAGWLFFISMLVGRAIAIIATHDDVTSFGDFLSRMDIWSSIGFLVFLIAVTIAIILDNKKRTRNS